MGKERARKANIPPVRGSFILLVIFALPILLIVGIVHFVWLLVDYPKYKKSHSKTDDGVAYSHRFFKSDSFRLNERLREQGSSIRIVCKDRRQVFFEGKNNYLFMEPNNWFFEVKEGELFISDDGLPFQKASEFLAKEGPENGKTTLLMLFPAEAVDLGYEVLDLSAFPQVIVADSIEGFAEALSDREANKTSI